MPTTATLYAALKRYGVHDWNCPKRGLPIKRDAPRPCTCGLDDVLERGRIVTLPDGGDVGA